MLRKTDRKFSIPSLKILLLVASIVLIASAPAAAFPDILPLPNGFQPEGIAIGDGPASIEKSLCVPVPKGPGEET